MLLCACVCVPGTGGSWPLGKSMASARTALYLVQSTLSLYKVGEPHGHEVYSRRTGRRIQEVAGEWSDSLPGAHSHTHTQCPAHTQSPPCVCVCVCTRHRTLSMPFISLTAALCMCVYVLLLLQEWRSCGRRKRTLITTMTFTWPVSGTDRQVLLLFTGRRGKAQ